MGGSASSVAPFASAGHTSPTPRVPVAAAVQRAGLVLAAIAVCAGAFGLGVAALVTQHQRVCTIERERAGYGRAHALAALNDPARAVGFNYRVASSTDDYDAKVMVVAGRFLGDTWQRDARGRVTHAVDLCRAELPPVLVQLTGLIPLDVSASAAAPRTF